MMGNRWFYDLRCCVCGRFVPSDADSEGPYGGPTDIDPPPDQFYCAECALKEKEDHIKAGWVPAVYRKAKWQLEVAQALAELEGE